MTEDENDEASDNSTSPTLVPFTVQVPTASIAPLSNEDVGQSWLPDDSVTTQYPPSEENNSIGFVVKELDLTENRHDKSANKIFNRCQSKPEDRDVFRKYIPTDTMSILLTYAIKHLILPEEIKVFNINYFTKTQPTRCRNFLDFCGQPANGLTFVVNNITCTNPCKACSFLQDDPDFPDVLIRNPCSLVHNGRVDDNSVHDALLLVISAETGIVRLKPFCPSMWDHWAFYERDTDGTDKCYVKCISVPDGSTAKSHGRIRPCISCPTWPPQIAREVRERMRKSKWLDHDAIEEVLRQECCVVPCSQPNSDMNNIHWQLEFYQTEKRLTELLTEEQRQCFSIFQVIVQHELCSTHNGLLDTGVLSDILNHLDTILFHVCDEMPVHIWKAHPGQCFLTLVQKLDHFVDVKHFPHYILPQRNLFEHLNDKNHPTLARSTSRLLESPLRAFEQLSQVHKFQNAWVLADLCQCQRLMGGHPSLVSNERILLPLALRLSKEFMKAGDPHKAYACLNDLIHEITSCQTDGNNPCCTDVLGFFCMIAKAERDDNFLWCLSMYLKHFQCLDISCVFDQDNVTDLQTVLDPHPICPEVANLTFPVFAESRVKEKVILLEQLVVILSRNLYECYESCVTLLICTYDISSRALMDMESVARDTILEVVSTENIIGAEYVSAVPYDAISSHRRETEVACVTRYREPLAVNNTCGLDRLASSSNLTGGMDVHHYKVARSLKESQYRCLHNLFQCYQSMDQLDQFEIFLDAFERLCEELGEPYAYRSYSCILRRLGYDERACEADRLAQCREDVAFGV